MLTFSKKILKKTSLYIKELELVAYEKEDLDRLIKFMYQGE